MHLVCLCIFECLHTEKLIENSVYRLYCRDFRRPFGCFVVVCLFVFRFPPERSHLVSCLSLWLGPWNLSEQRDYQLFTIYVVALPNPCSSLFITTSLLCWWVQSLWLSLLVACIFYSLRAKNG